MGRGFLLARFLYIFQHWQRRAKQFGCLMRGKGGKLLIVHARVAIRIVGNTAHRCVFGSIDNLALFSHLKGMDPQYNFKGETDYSYTPNKTYSFGVEINF